MCERTIEPMESIIKTVGNATQVLIRRFPPCIGIAWRFLAEAAPNYVHRVGNAVTFTPDNGWAKYQLVDFDRDGECFICELEDSCLEAPSDQT